MVQRASSPRETVAGVARNLEFVAGPDASVEEASHSLLQFPSFLLQHVFGTPRLCGRLQVHSSRLYLRYDQSVCPVGIASSCQDLDFRRKLDTLRASDYRSLMQFIHKVCFDQQKALRALSLCAVGDRIPPLRPRRRALLHR